MDRLDDVLTETAVVRRELGYPGMATPFSQLVGTQAVLNIVTGERYSVVPDEVIQYACGFYGQPAGPIDPEVCVVDVRSVRGAGVAGAADRLRSAGASRSVATSTVGRGNSRRVVDRDHRDNGNQHHGFAQESSHTREGAHRGGWRC